MGLIKTLEPDLELEIQDCYHTHLINDELIQPKIYADNTEKISCLGLLIFRKKTFFINSENNAIPAILPKKKAIVNVYISLCLSRGF